jgi:hypothetical protein
MEDSLVSEIFSLSSAGELSGQSHQRIDVSESKIHYENDYYDRGERIVDFVEYPVFTIDGILLPAECDRLISLGNQIGFQNLDAESGSNSLRPCDPSFPTKGSQCCSHWIWSYRILETCQIQ